MMILCQQLTACVVVIIVVIVVVLVRSQLLFVQLQLSSLFYFLGSVLQLLGNMHGPECNHTTINRTEFVPIPPSKCRRTSDIISKIEMKVCRNLR